MPIRKVFPTHQTAPNHWIHLKPKKSPLKIELKIKFLNSGNISLTPLPLELVPTLTFQNNMGLVIPLRPPPYFGQSL